MTNFLKMCIKPYEQKAQRKAEIAAQPKYGREFRSLTITQTEITVTVYALAVTYERETERHRPAFFPNIHAIKRYKFDKTQAKTDYVEGLLNEIAENPDNDDYQWVAVADDYTNDTRQLSILTKAYYNADYILAPIKTCVFIDRENLEKLKELKKQKGQFITFATKWEKAFAHQQNVLTGH